MTSLPAAEQWVIARLTDAECAEMIDQHIDFVDKDGRPVHLQPKLVRHYMKRDDGALPTIVAITTLARRRPCARTRGRIRPAARHRLSHPARGRGLRATAGHRR